MNINLEDPGSSIELRFPATNEDVRESMVRVRQLLTDMDVLVDDIGTVELVLAEALNNIVEHACAECAYEIVGLDLKRKDSSLDCLICDPGKPMPNNTPPLGRAADPSVDLDLLPEGGFGWMLIRSLSKNILYQRIGDKNQLSLSIPLKSTEESDGK